MRSRAPSFPVLLRAHGMVRPLFESGERATDSGGFGRAMQLGFNTNFRYRDVVFHVQTEDSGRANPHVITHLFHGGNIIASVKSDYSDLLEEADVEAAVRRLMETQHKAMLKQLSRGEHDGAIHERLGTEVLGAAADPGSPSVSVSVSGTGSASRPGSTASSASVSAASSAASSGAKGASASESASMRLAPSASASASASASSESEDAAPLQARTGSTPSVAAARRDSSSGLARVFGERVVSEKPLDEVVLDYLVENARKRKRQPKP